MKTYSIKEFEEKLFQPVFPLKNFVDLNCNPLYNSLPNWRRSGLLPFIPRGDWSIEVSLSQLIWLRILDNLRAFGYPVKDTAKVTDYFFKDAYFNDISTKNLQNLQQLLEKRKATTPLTEEENQQLLDLSYILGDPLLLYSLKLDVSYLSNLIIWCTRLGQEAGILIFPQGKVVEKRGEHYENHNGEIFDIEQPHIYISIKSLLKEFVDKKELEEIVIPYLLEDEEKIVIKELRKKNIKEIRVLVQSEKIIRIDCETQLTITDEQASEIKKMLRMKNYEEVTISTRDNRTINFNRTNKIMTSGKSGSKD